MESFRDPTQSTVQSNSDDEEMDLYLKIMKTVPLNLKGSETIKNVKSLINEREGICEKDQDLFFNGNLLADGHRLVDYGIQRNSTIHLIVKNYVALKIFVRIPSKQRIIMVEARTSDTVHNIKSMVQAKEGILSDKFDLLYEGCLLEDDKTLAYLGIRSYCTMHLVFCQKEVLSIFVKAPNLKILKLSVKVMFTVRDVKEIAVSMIGDSGSYWNLFYGVNQLDDSKTLAFYDIEEESFLRLLPTAIQIFVKTGIGKTIVLVMQRCDTVKDIKSKVFEKVRIPIEVQNIVYAGKRLENDRSLASYNILRDSTLHMVFSKSH